MENKITDSILGIYMNTWDEKTSSYIEKPIEDEGIIYDVWDRLYQTQKIKVLESISKGNKDISMSIREEGDSYFIGRIWNNLDEKWEDWSGDWLEAQKNPIKKEEKEQNTDNILINKMFEAGVRDCEEYYRKLEKKLKEKYDYQI